MTLYLRLLRQFILRGLTREKTRACVTLVGIALGVALIVAIRLANRSALESFRAATESVAGRASLDITGPTGRFDELLLRDLLWLRGYGSLSPIVEGFALIPSADPQGSAGEFLQVLGVDILRDRPLRDYRLLELTPDGKETTGREFLDLLVDPDAVILTERLALKRGLSIGERIELLIDDRRLGFTIRGLLLDEGPARALDGYFALMDIAAAQKAFDRFGLVDRLDIKLRGDLPLEEARKELESRLPPGLRVREPGEKYRQVETMIASFHFNLTALGSLALLVGLFLIYNTAAFSVLRRRREIGRLRAVGASRRMVFGLFLGEAFLLALPGSLIGLLLGRLLAAGTVQATASTVATFYIAEVARETVRDFSIGRVEVLLALGLAVPLSLLAAFLPAREATRIPPWESAREGADAARGPRRWRRSLLLSPALAAAAWVFCLFDPVGDIPVFGYLAALSLLFAASFLVPALLRAVCRLAERWIFRRLPGLAAEGMLARANLSSATPRVSITVAALAVSLAMTVAIAVMVGSFRRTVIYWLRETMSADLFARAATLKTSIADGVISKAAVDAIRADPQVAEVDTLIRRDIEYRGHSITLGARRFDVLVERGSLHFKSPANARSLLRSAETSDRVIVSESFSYRFRRGPGDRVELFTRSGSTEFVVAAVFYDYSNNRGVVLADLETYRRHFAVGDELERPSDVAIFLEPGADAAEAKGRLARDVGGEHRLVFRTSAGVLAGSLQIFDSTFAITYALQVIAITVAALGVISTLITLLLERRREIAVLRFLGASRRQVQVTVVLEALLLGAVSQFLGILAGCLLAMILILVINLQSFGWTIRFSLPFDYLLQSTLFVVLAAAVAGFYPAVRASRVKAVHFVGEE